MLPLLRDLWSLFDGIWGVLKGSWGVLAESQKSCCVICALSEDWDHLSSRSRRSSSGSPLIGSADLGCLKGTA